MLGAIAILVVSFAISIAIASVPRKAEPRSYGPGQDTGHKYEQVSLVRLLAHPELYDGREVSVGGYVSLKFEDFGLHLGPQEYDGGLRESALWLERPDWLTSSAERRLDERYAEVGGTFRASERGHMSDYSGAIAGVRFIRPRLTQTEYMALQLEYRRGVLMQRHALGWFLTIVGWMGLGLWWSLTRPGR